MKNTTNLTTNSLTAWQKQVPLQLTLSRVYVLPLILTCFYFNTFYSNTLAAILFIAASITDYFDGYYARKWGLVSNLGKFLDPVTDKILVLSVLIYLSHIHFVDPYLVIILTLRDTFIGGIRSAAAADSIVIDAKASGKWKTGIQMASIPAMIVGKSYNNLFPNLELNGFFIYLGQVGSILLWFSTCLSIFSAVEYYKIYRNNSKI